MRQITKLMFLFVVFTVISKIGSETGGLALIWHIHNIDSRALSIGLLVTLNTIAAVVSYPIAGMIFDLFSRSLKRIWIFLSLVSGSIYILVSVIDDLSLIYIIVFLMGIIGGFGIIFFESSLSLLFDSERLVKVNSLLRLSNTAISLIVPIVVGLIVDKFNAGLALVLAGMILVSRTPFVASIAGHVKASDAIHERGSLKDSMVGFMRRIPELYRREKEVFVVLIASSISDVFLGVVPVVYIIKLADTLNITALNVGVVWTVIALGGILGSILLGSIKVRPKPGYIGLGIAALAFLTLSLSLASGLKVILVIALMWGIASAFLQIILDSYIQSTAPKDHKGLIISLRNVLEDSGFALSGIVSGLLIDLIGVHQSLIIAGLVSSVLGLMLIIKSYNRYS
ncbi:MAG: MFS transporter [Desulfurococcales archaeon]|nr:MFS transporter [Desulfurococcales archaeon]